jgi:hypothetical protein
MKKFFLFFFILICLNAYSAEPDIVITQKTKANGGIFGYNQIERQRTEEFDINGKKVVKYFIMCANPGFQRCDFIFNAGCANDNFPFTDLFYNNQFDCIEAQIESGINNGNILFINNTNDCSAHEQSYRIQLNWTSSDVYNSNEEIIIEKMPFVIP